MGAKGLIARGPPPAASWLIFIKGAILILSLLLFCLSCYAASVLARGAAGFMIFVTIYSLATFGVSLGLELWAPHAFFRIGAVVLYLLSIIFWLAGWAYSASSAALNFYYGFVTYGSVMAACAGLGAITWILIIILTVFFLIACVKNEDSTYTPAPKENVELGQAQMQNPQTMPAQAPMQATYPTGQPPMQTPSPAPMQSYGGSTVYGQPDPSAQYAQQYPQQQQQYPQQPQQYPQQLDGQPYTAPNTQP